MEQFFACSIIFLLFNNGYVIIGAKISRRSLGGKSYVEKNIRHCYDTDQYVRVCICGDPARPDAHRGG